MPSRRCSTGPTSRISAALVRAIRLAERQGMPLSATLTVLADEARAKRQILAEEKALKIPVKMTFPLVLFILPALFLLILGPAVLDFGSSGF